MSAAVLADFEIGAPQPGDQALSRAVADGFCPSEGGSTAMMERRSRDKSGEVASGIEIEKAKRPRPSRFQRPAILAHALLKRQDVASPLGDKRLLDATSNVDAAKRDVGPATEAPLFDIVENDRFARRVALGIGLIVAIDVDKPDKKKRCKRHAAEGKRHDAS
jgi:hypothetical protein